MKHHQNGFTLVELAIALMIIGLLIGGVLKGQELIENARVTRVAKDITDYDAAIMIFRNTYNGLPGDIRRPSRIPNCTGDCAVTEASTGNGRVDTSTKTANFWRHLERAGVISGAASEPDNTNPYATYCYSPLNAFSGYDVVVHISADPALRLQEGNVFIPFHDKNPMHSVPCTTGYLDSKRASALDQKIDDGKPFTGLARIPLGTNAANTCHDGTNEEYIATPSTVTCHLRFRLGSLN